jgi:hypothetical protein
MDELGLLGHGPIVRFSTFNSLSRDHRASIFRKARGAERDFQLPLSGSRTPKPRLGKPGRRELSTPSLGITEAKRMNLPAVIRYLSTPSLGITSLSSAADLSGIQYLSTPSLGITCPSAG